MRDVPDSSHRIRLLVPGALASTTTSFRSVASASITAGLLSRTRFSRVSRRITTDLPVRMCNGAAASGTACCATLTAGTPRTHANASASPFGWSIPLMFVRSPLASWPQRRRHREKNEERSAGDRQSVGEMNRTSGLLSGRLQGPKASVKMEANRSRHFRERRARLLAKSKIAKRPKPAGNGRGQNKDHRVPDSEPRAYGGHELHVASADATHEKGNKKNSASQERAG